MKTSLLKILVCTISLSFSLDALAQGWVTSSRYITGKDGIKKSVLQFSKGAQSITYTPQEDPWGMVDVQMVPIKKRDPIFVTTWANGKTVMFRVFDPENFGKNPLCSPISFGESTEVKVEGKELKLLIYPDETGPEKWVPCGENMGRLPNSKPSKKK